MITFHKAKVEDVLEVKKLLYKTWTTAYSNIYSPDAIDTVTSEWHSPKLLTKQILNKKAYFGVGKDGKKIFKVKKIIMPCIVMEKTIQSKE